MKQYLFYLLFSFSLCSHVFAQDITLVGQWKLVKVEVTDPSEKDISASEAFFAFYQDQTHLLKVDQHFFPVNIGGEELPYTYKIDGKHLVLMYQNTILIKEGDAAPKEKTSVGETTFLFNLEGNVLTLSRRNETFKEFYQFQKITN